MAINKARKERLVADLTEKFKATTSVVFAEFSGLSVTDTDTLRKQAREEGISVSVAKKTLMNVAAKEAGLQDVDTTSLPNSIVTLFGHDEIGPAKLVAEFAKEHKEQVSIAGGVLEGVFQTSEQMVALSMLPSKTELYAKLVGSMNAPVSGFVNALQGNLRNFVYVMKAIQEKNA